MVYPRWIFSVLAACAMFFGEPVLSGAENKSTSGKAFELTLDECFHLALARSDSLRVQEQQVKVAEAQYDEAIGTILPNLHVISSERLQDGIGQSNQNSNTGFTPGMTGAVFIG